MADADRQPGRPWMRRLVDFTARTSKSKLLRNVGVYSVDFGLQVVVQVAFFVMISRSLGPAAFGIFGAMTAITIITSVFVGLGCDQLLIQHVAADRSSFARNLGHALVSIAITFPLLGVACFALLTTIETGDLSPGIIALLIAADLLFTKILFLAKAAFMAVENARRQLAINLGSSFLKLAIAAAVIHWTESLTLATWVIWYSVGAIVSGSLALLLAIHDIGRPRWAFFPQQWKLGFQFCLEFAAVAALRDADKPVVVEAVNPVAAGHYAAAFRVVDTASVPIRALLYATYTRYFQKSGGGHGMAFGIRILPYAAALGALVTLAILVFAPLVTLLLGSQYAESIVLIQLLSTYPLLMALIGIGGDVLRASGLQWLRVILVLAAGLAMVAGCYAGAVLAETQGAGLARILVLVVFVTVSWSIIAVRWRRTRPR